MARPKKLKQVSRLTEKEYFKCSLTKHYALDLLFFVKVTNMDINIMSKIAVLKSNLHFKGH